MIKKCLSLKQPYVVFSKKTIELRTGIPNSGGKFLVHASLEESR